MKRVLIIAGALALAACSEPIPPEQWKQEEVSLQTVKGLEDCAFITMKLRTSGDPIRVIRCPNSNTTTSYKVPRGKSSAQLETTVVDEAPVVAVRKSKLEELDKVIAAQQEQIAKLRQELVK